MTSHIHQRVLAWLRYVGVFVCVSLVSWLYLSQRVWMNAPNFSADEMYWVGTARIIPLLVNKNTTDPFWNEFYGYVNFNGAKLLYGGTLWAMGHRDYAFTGYPPETFFTFSKIQGQYPVDDPHYPILRDARLINALFASFAVGLMSIFVLLLFESIVPAFVAAVVLFVHPIFQDIASIAYADAMFLFFELLFLVMLEIYVKNRNKSRQIIIVLLLGATLAMITAIKMNGLLFAGVFLLYALGHHKLFSSSAGWEGMFWDVLVLAVAFTNVFLLLHPNFFFPGAAGPIQIIEGRLRITAYHMSYFDKATPGDVLWTVPERIVASMKHLFVGTPLGFLSLISGIYLLLRNFQVPYTKQLGRLMLNTVYVYDVMIQYVVLSWSRYLLPILPFCIVFAVYFFAVVTRSAEKS